jgi:hypothetical protein
MYGDNDSDYEIVDGVEMEQEHQIELTLSTLEWEIVNLALNAPLKNHVIKGLREKGFTHEDHIIESALEDLSDRWANTW